MDPEVGAARSPLPSTRPQGNTAGGTLSGSPAPVGALTHAMVTRTRDITRTVKQHKDGTITSDPSKHAFLVTREPADHREAILSPEWRDVM